MIPATRQNSGRSGKATTGWPPRSPAAGNAIGKALGGLNVPAGTRWASVTVVFGNPRSVKLSQVVAASVEPQAEAASRNNFRLVLIRFVPSIPSTTGSDISRIETP